MKKTIKSIVIGLALTVMANGQRSLTLEDIDYLYKNAVADSAQKAISEVVKLQTNYANALKLYRENLFDVRTLDSVATIAAIDKEIANWLAGDGDPLQPLVDGADIKMKSFRATYDRKLEDITKASTLSGENLRKVLIAQLEALQKSLIKGGDMRGALEVHNRLEKLGVSAKQEDDSVAELDNKCVLLTKTNGGYVNAVSKQKLKLTPGTDYTLTFLVKFSGKVLSSHDCLPRFRRADGTNYEGGDKNKMQKAQRHSEKLKISNASEGWEKITVKFTHFYDETVRFGLEFYSPDGSDYQVAMKDFTLTDSEGNNLINKNLNSSVGWEGGDYIAFTGWRKK